MVVAITLTVIAGTRFGIGYADLAKALKEAMKTYNK